MASRWLWLGLGAAALLLALAVEAWGQTFCNTVYLGGEAYVECVDMQRPADTRRSWYLTRDGYLAPVYPPDGSGILSISPFSGVERALESPGNFPPGYAVDSYHPFWDWKE